MSLRLAVLKQRRRGHDPGRVIRDLAVMLADGGECVSDLGAVRDQGALFGPVASDSTAFRVIDRVASERLLGELRAAHARARERFWKLHGAPMSLTIDIDATLITSHSEEGSAGNYKGGGGRVIVTAKLSPINRARSASENVVQADSGPPEPLRAPGAPSWFDEAVSFSEAITSQTPDVGQSPTRPVRRAPTWEVRASERASRRGRGTGQAIGVSNNRSGTAQSGTARVRSSVPVPRTTRCLGANSSARRRFPFHASEAEAAALTIWLSWRQSRCPHPA